MGRVFVLNVIMPFSVISTIKVSGSESIMERRFWLVLLFSVIGLGVILSILLWGDAYFIFKHKSKG